LYVEIPLCKNNDMHCYNKFTENNLDFATALSDVKICPARALGVSQFDF